jgi:hypothetical protein
MRENQISHALFVGVSFLPRLEQGAYPQMPIQAITKQQYEEMVQRIDPSALQGTPVYLRPDETVIERYCDSDRCDL